MTLDELHANWMQLEYATDLARQKADRAKQWFVQEVAIHIDTWSSKPKAETRVILDQVKWYEKMMDLIRTYKNLDTQNTRAKSTYYHERKKVDGESQLDSSASIMWRDFS